MQGKTHVLENVVIKKKKITSNDKERNRTKKYNKKYKELPVTIKKETE